MRRKTIALAVMAALSVTVAAGSFAPAALTALAATAYVAAAQTFPLNLPAVYEPPAGDALFIHRNISALRPSQNWAYFERAHQNPGCLFGNDISPTTPNQEITGLSSAVASTILSGLRKISDSTLSQFMNASSHCLLTLPAGRSHFKSPKPHVQDITVTNKGPSTDRDKMSAPLFALCPKPGHFSSFAFLGSLGLSSFVQQVTCEERVVSASAY